MAYDHGWLVITDDMYEEISYIDGKIPHILHADPRLRDQTVLSNGVSKSFAMTGWRIGWSVGPIELIKAMNKIQSQSTSNPRASQYASPSALTGPQDFPVNCARPLSRAGPTCRDPATIPESPASIQGTFYVFPNFSLLRKIIQWPIIDWFGCFGDYLSAEARSLQSGRAFGADAFIRFSSPHPWM
jgi:aspartate aminotransferase